MGLIELGAMLIHSPQCLAKMTQCNNKTDIATTVFTWEKKQIGGNKPITLNVYLCHIRV